MLDLTTERGRIISAALGLASERAWNGITLADIAERAGTTLVGLKAHFASKGEIIAAFAGMVDDEVLRQAPRRQPGQTARDALFEVIMCRFDVLEPWKSSLRSISREATVDPSRLAPLLTSQRWMLEAAGISADGVNGGFQVAGLAGIYASVFRTWLDDDDAGLAWRADAAEGERPLQWRAARRRRSRRCPARQDIGTHREPPLRATVTARAAGAHRVADDLISQSGGCTLCQRMRCSP
jgi:ubiquinone biosynthesis protein COQ9